MLTLRVRNGHRCARAGNSRRCRTRRHAPGANVAPSAHRAHRRLCFVALAPTVTPPTFHPRQAARHARAARLARQAPRFQPSAKRGASRRRKARYACAAHREHFNRCRGSRNATTARQDLRASKERFFLWFAHLAESPTRHAALSANHVTADSFVLSPMAPSVSDAPLDRFARRVHRRRSRANWERSATSRTSRARQSASAVCAATFASRAASSRRPAPRASTAQAKGPACVSSAPLERTSPIGAPMHASADPRWRSRRLAY